MWHSALFSLPEHASIWMYFRTEETEMIKLNKLVTSSHVSQECDYLVPVLDCELKAWDGIDTKTDSLGF